MHQNHIETFLDAIHEVTSTKCDEAWNMIERLGHKEIKELLVNAEGE